MTEPDVTLTDYGLALECAVFAGLLFRRRSDGDRFHPWPVVFFIGVALASLAGGTVHGFFLDERSLGYRVFWPLSMLAIGVTSLAGLMLGARLALPSRLAVWVSRAAWLQLLGYAWLVLFVVDAFWLAIADYLPAALLLLVGFTRMAWRHHSGRVAMGAWGLALTFAASALQQFRVALHPVYFNHNALYHLIQAVALAFVFLGCRGLNREKGDPHADPS